MAAVDTTNVPSGTYSFSAFDPVSGVLVGTMTGVFGPNPLTGDLEMGGDVIDAQTLEVIGFASGNYNVNGDMWGTMSHYPCPTCPAELGGRFHANFNAPAVVGDVAASGTWTITCSQGGSN